MVQEVDFIEPIAPCQYLVKQGFVPNMRVPGTFYVNERLKSLIFEELQAAVAKGGVGGFLPAVKQLANVAALPGIVQARPLAVTIESRSLNMLHFFKLFFKLLATIMMVVSA